MDRLIDSAKAIALGVVALFLTKWIVLLFGGGLRLQRIPTTSQLTTVLVSLLISTAVGGFVAALLSRRNALVNSLIAGVVALALDVYHDRHDPSGDAVWLMFLCAGPLAIGAAAGVLLRGRRMQN